MYTVRDAFNFCYAAIGQHGASRLAGPQNFMYLINHAVNMIYNYEGYIWTFTHRKDLFNMRGEQQGALLSRWPVRKIDKFHTGGWIDIDKIKEDPCFCDMNLPDKIIKACCECECTVPCKPLLLEGILPQNELCPGTYQISGGFVPGQGGLDGRIVKVDAGKPVKDLWMSYFCGPIKLEKFDDVVPLPDSFMHVIGWIIAAAIVPMWGAARQQEDLSYLSLYRKELDYLRKVDNIMPERITFEEPLYEKNPTVATSFSPSGINAW